MVHLVISNRRRRFGDRAIDGLEQALAAIGLLDEALALDVRRPQDFFNRVWSTAFRAADLTAQDEREVSA